MLDCIQTVPKLIGTTANVLQKGEIFETDIPYYCTNYIKEKNYYRHFSDIQEAVIKIFFVSDPTEVIYIFMMEDRNHLTC